MPKSLPPELIRKSEAMPLQEAIHRMLEVYGLTEKYESVQIIQSLRDLLELSIGERGSDIFIRNNRIFIKVEAATLRKELAMWRDRLLTRLKEKEPKAVNIEAIVLI